MKRIYALCALSIAIVQHSFGQFQELTAGVGYAAYFGDLNLNDNRFLGDIFGEGFRPKNMKMSYSLGYRYNFAKNLSVGLNFYHMYLSGADSDNPNPVGYDATFYRKTRNLSFFTAVNEGFVDVRYEFFRNSQRMNPTKKWFVSPYLGAGFGFFKFNPKTMYNGQEVELQPLGTEGQGTTGYASKYSLFEMVVPVNLGVRFYEPQRRFAISLEFNYNHTFTDYIDDVSTVYVNPAVFYANYSADKAALATALSNRNNAGTGFEYITDPGQQRGDSKHNDYFMTAQFKFSYFFHSKDRDAYYKCCGF